jgi:hypothetical protein
MCTFIYTFTNDPGDYHKFLAKRDIAPVDRLTRPAGVVDTKVKSIGGCTGGGTATNYGVCSAGKLIGYAGKVNGRCPAAVDVSCSKEYTC